MKKRIKIVVIIAVILIILVSLILGVNKLIKDYKEDVKKTKKILSEITEDYADFEKKINPYNKDLTKLINMLNENSYYEKIKKNQKAVIEQIEIVSKEVEEISSYENLKEHCTKTYADGKASRACKSFSKTYEKSVNVYIDIITAYNNIIDKANNISDGKQKLEKYDNKIKNYIDYDKDGKYLGKESTSMEVVND